MNTVFAIVDDRLVNGLSALFFFLRWFLAFLPGVVAWVRQHPGKWWIFSLTFLSVAWSQYGWVTQLVGRIYFAITGPIQFGGGVSAQPKPVSGVESGFIVWSAIAWLIAMVWATRTINASRRV
jgi:hypothetical protein